MALTVRTRSAGLQGGRGAPVVSVGAGLGAARAGLRVLPSACCAALGYAAVFGSATNTLLAPALIGAEVFGWAAAPHFFAVGALAYAGNGGRSIYSGQKGIQRPFSPLCIAKRVETAAILYCRACFTRDILNELKNTAQRHALHGVEAVEVRGQFFVGAGGALRVAGAHVAHELEKGVCCAV